MAMTDYLISAYPELASTLRRAELTDLPTPVSVHDIACATGRRTVMIKHDDQTSSIYGGNKVRKLEYLLQRAKDRGAKRVATFGAAGSNHALATALHARQLGLDCTCFLAHQSKTPNISRTLNKHLQIGTELLRYGGSVNRLELYRRYLQDRNIWVIPLGGTCWLGAAGFVNAGLELAAQISDGTIEIPDRIYMANGTMGSVAGLALGLAASNLPIDIHAVRVADNRFVKRDVLERLIHKTASLLNRFDPSFPISAAQRARIVWRSDFYADGYAKVDAVTEDAVAFARRELDLRLETTYTGKAMAALRHDLRAGDTGTFMFWNTYNSRPITASAEQPDSLQGLPDGFERYYQ